MKKQIFFIAFTLLLLFSQAIYAENETVSCSNGMTTVTIMIPSTNAQCYTSNISEKAPEGKPITEAKLTQSTIALNDYKTQNKFASEIAVFPIASLSSLNPEIYNQAVNLTNMINTLNSGNASIAAPIPFLPYQTDSQLTLQLADKITFSEGTGIRFITAYGTPNTSVNNENLIYTMQGLTNDGKQYVSVIIPIKNSMITGNIDLATFNWQALPPESWNPSLTLLDEIVQSIRIQ